MSHESQPSRLEQLQQRQAFIDGALSKASSMRDALQNGDSPFTPRPHLDTTQSDPIAAIAATETLATVEERLSGRAIPYLQEERLRIEGEITSERGAQSIRDAEARVASLQARAEAGTISRIHYERALAALEKLREQQLNMSNIAPVQQDVPLTVNEPETVSQPIPKAEERSVDVDQKQPRSQVSFGKEERYIAGGGVSFSFGTIRTTTWDTIVHVLEHAGELVDRAELEEIERKNKERGIVFGSVDAGIDAIRQITEVDIERPEILIELKDENSTYYHLEPSAVRLIDQEKEIIGEENILPTSQTDEVTHTSIAGVTELPLDPEDIDDATLDDETFIIAAAGIEQSEAVYEKNVYKALEIAISRPDITADEILGGFGTDEYGDFPSTTAARKMIHEAIEELRQLNRKGELANDALELHIQCEEFLDFKNLQSKNKILKWLEEKLPVPVRTPEESRIMRIRTLAKGVEVKQPPRAALSLILDAMLVARDVSVKDVVDLCFKEDTESNDQKTRTWAHAYRSISSAIGILTLRLEGGIASEDDHVLLRKIQEVTHTQSPLEALKAFQAEKRIKEWMGTRVAGSPIGPSIESTNIVTAPSLQTQHEAISIQEDHEVAAFDAGASDVAPLEQDRETAHARNETITPIEDIYDSPRNFVQQYISEHPLDRFPKKVGIRTLDATYPGISKFISRISRSVGNFRMNNDGTITREDVPVAIALYQHKNIAVTDEAIINLRHFVSQGSNLQNL